MDAWERSACYPRSTFYLLIRGPSIRNPWVTRSWFPICSTYRSRSQARLYPYTLRAIADRTERTFELLRYSLGGDRPSQTAHKTLSLDRIHGRRLEFQTSKGGISLLAPPRLASWLQSLPPILHRLGRNPISCYSKGSRGLFVLPRVCGIFTTTTVSPGRWLRQCSCRYAIRAGRNLPD
jgi:hypothetical protein